METQIYVSSEDGKLFDVSFCSNESIFKIIELSKADVDEMLLDIETQVNLLKGAYEESLHSKEKEAK